MLLRNLESPNKNKIKWLLKAIKKPGKPEIAVYSKVTNNNNVDEIIPVKTQVKDKGGNAKDIVVKEDDGIRK